MAYIFVADSMGLSSFIFVMGSEKRIFCGTECISAVQGHPRSFDFGTNRKGICDFLLVINSNFGPILHRFWDTATYWICELRIFPTTPLFDASAQGDPVRISGWNLPRKI